MLFGLLFVACLAVAPFLVDLVGMHFFGRDWPL